MKNAKQGQKIVHRMKLFRENDVDQYIKIICGRQIKGRIRSNTFELYNQI